jgi:hypothetical protein
MPRTLRARWRHPKETNMSRRSDRLSVNAEARYRKDR